MKLLLVLLAFLAVVLASMRVRRRATASPVAGGVLFDGSGLHNRRSGDQKPGSNDAAGGDGSGDGDGGGN